MQARAKARPGKRPLEPEAFVMKGNLGRAGSGSSRRALSLEPDRLKPVPAGLSLSLRRSAARPRVLRPKRRGHLGAALQVSVMSASEGEIVRLDGRGN